MSATTSTCRSARSSAPARSKSPTRSATVAVSGDDVYEDLFTASLELQDILERRGFVTRVRLGMAGLVDDAERSDLVVVYRAMGEFRLEQQRALTQAVERGCGLLAIHSSNVFAGDAGSVDASWRPAYELIGSRYLSHGLPPHESRFTVELDPADELTRGIAPFEVSHEHYVLETTPETRVLAWREHAQGAEPLLHTRVVGRGRVCYLQLGHDMRVWREPSVREIVACAAEWAQRTEQGGPVMASPSLSGASR